MTSPLGTFFGRQSELDELARAAQSHRVVTVCGPAGVGKTTLLRQWLREREGLVVDLTDAADDVALETMIISTQGVSLAGDADERARRRALRALLDEHDGVLAVDNAERFVGNIADLVSDTEFDDCRFVIASRARIGHPDEHVVQLDPFALDGDEPEALAYLRWRARKLGGTHELRDDEAPDARALARRLDGLPLALDLAAARLNLLRPAKLLERLERSADVLGGEHTRSLTEALLTSWDAAGDQEREALRVLAVLEGPFDPQLGEALIGESGLELLQRLRDRSVIVVDPDGRLRLLLSVRDFVRERTSKTQREDAIARLTRALADRGEEWLEAASRLEPLETIETLRANAAHLRVAVTANTADDDRVSVCATALAEAALLDGTSARVFDLLRDRQLDARLRVAIARLATDLGRLDEADRLLAEDERFDALLARAQSAQLSGNLELAEQLVTTADALADGDLQRGRAAASLGGIRYHRGEYDDAREHYELALRHARRAGDRRTEARALQNLGTVHTDQMRLDLARRCLNEAVQHHRVVGDVLREAWAHNGLGVVALREADPAHGIEALGRAAELFDRVGHRAGAGTARANLAMIAVDTGRWDDGVRHSLDALERASAEEDPYIAGMSMLCLALCTWLRGDRDAAGRHFCDFEPTIERDAHIQLALSWDAAFGAYLAATGDDERAEEVFARTEARLSDDDGHEIYRTMFRLARAHSLLREIRHAERDREEVALELLDAVTGVDPGRSEPLRYTVSLLEHEAPDELAALLRHAASAPPEALLVAPGFHAYRPPGSRWQTLGRSPSLWRLFGALAEAARNKVGPLDLDALQEATWPGETLTIDSATNRLHVSLSKLRKAGLKPVLAREGDGYVLDCPVQFL